MQNIYFSNGNMQDTEGAGLNTRVTTQDDDGQWVAVSMQEGKPYHGYQACEITKERYDEIQSQILRPDNVDYFWGALGPVGLVDAATHAKLEIMRAEAKLAYLEKSAAANRIKFKISAREARALKEDHKEVFEVMYPDVNADVVQFLFNVKTQ